VARKTEKVHRPVFAGSYQRFAAQAMEKGEAAFRRELLDSLAGPVIPPCRFSTSQLDGLAPTRVFGLARQRESAGT
jgi:hypothetical protein